MRVVALSEKAGKDMDLPSGGERGMEHLIRDPGSLRLANHSQDAGDEKRRLSMEALLATPRLWAITVVRVVLGVIFFAHGSQKVLGWFGGYGLKGTTEYFVSTGLSRPLAYLVCFFEFLGGLGLFFGFLTRLAALAVGIVMVGAIARVHWRNGFFLNWEITPGKGHGLEANLAYLAMAIACLIAGGGALSLDGLIVP
jgi:putative oxidoreductase